MDRQAPRHDVIGLGSTVLSIGRADRFRVGS